VVKVLALDDDEKQALLHVSLAQAEFIAKLKQYIDNGVLYLSVEDMDWFTSDLNLLFAKYLRRLGFTAGIELLYFVLQTCSFAEQMDLEARVMVESALERLRP
jgi:hypothetical protein